MSRMCSLSKDDDAAGKGGQEIATLGALPSGLLQGGSVNGETTMRVTCEQSVHSSALSCF